MARYRQDAGPLIVEWPPLPVDHTPRSTLTVCEASHTPPGFRRARRLNCWRKAWRTFPNDAFHKTARGQKRYAASMTRLKGAGVI